MKPTLLEEMAPDLLNRAEKAGNRATVDGDPVNLKARSLLVRLIAGAIAGGTDPLVQALARNAGAGPNSLLINAPSVATPASAAAVHAAAITVAQCDDGLREAAGHPGLHAFSAAWSVAEQHDLDLNGVLKAFVMGWEIGAWLGLLLGRPSSGVHPHGGWGTAAAAVAAAVAAGQRADQQEAALRCSLSVALSGPDSTIRSGRSAHYLLPALGTANGVQVGLLGLDVSAAPVDALSHFASVVHGRSDPASDLVDWGTEPLLLSSYVKPIGLCAHTLTSWTACDVAREQGVLGDVTGIEVITYGAAAGLDQKEGRTQLGRRFSVPWAVAYGLTGRRPTADDADLMAWAALVSVRHDPALDHGYPARRPSTVRFVKGTKVLAEVHNDFHPGDRELPLSAMAERAVIAQLLGDAEQERQGESVENVRAAPGHSSLRTLCAALGTASHHHYSTTGGKR